MSFGFWAGDRTNPFSAYYSYTASEPLELAEQRAPPQPLGLRKRTVRSPSSALNLAPELAARGIAINAIAPGGTRTDMSAENASHYKPPALKDLSLQTLYRWALP